MSPFQVGGANATPFVGPVVFEGSLRTGGTVTQTLTLLAPAGVLTSYTFADTFRAQEFLTAATRLAANQSLRLRDAVIVTKDATGKTVVRETVDLQPGRSAMSGALWAGLFGWLFFREPVTGATTAGALLIVAGCWIATRGASPAPERVAA